MSKVHLVLPGVAEPAAASAPPGSGANNSNHNNNKMYAFAKLDAEGSFSASVERSLRKAGKEMKGRPNEILPDTCGMVLVVLDNSMSMTNRDGKVVTVVPDTHGQVKIRHGATRWEEACSKVRHIVAYNISREMQTVVFLLNPKRECRWRANEDYCIIDPKAGKAQRKNVQLRLEAMMNARHVRGSTPLHIVMKHIRSEISKFESMAKNVAQANEATGDAKLIVAAPICVNLVTDGQPDHRGDFEVEIRSLAKEHKIFLTVNLCTDDDSIVDYYNGLDEKLGSEVSGCDVLDDYEAEAQEIRSCGNDFFTYTHALHVCRMAGCSSKEADMMDEKKMPLHSCLSLVDQLLRIPVKQRLHDADNYATYIERVAQLSAEVQAYDPRLKKVRPLVNSKAIEAKLRSDKWWRQLREQVREWEVATGLSRQLAVVTYPAKIGMTLAGKTDYEQAYVISRAFCVVLVLAVLLAVSRMW